jgi:hypothetical protein
MGEGTGVAIALGIVAFFGGCTAYMNQFMNQLANPTRFTIEEKIEYIGKDRCLTHKIGCPE